MFGEIVAEYNSAVDGKMSAYRTDATSTAPHGVHADNESSYPE